MQVKIKLEKFPFPEVNNKVAMLLVKDRKLLIHRRVIYPKNCFRLPTGTVKPGESWEEALKRELKEEFDISVRKSDYQAIGEIDYLIKQKEKTIKFKEKIYLIKVRKIKPNKKELGEIKWIKFEDLPKIHKKLKQLKNEWKYWGKLRSILPKVVYELYKKGKIEI